MGISWKSTRKKGIVSEGIKQIGGSSVTWTIKKSAGGLSYELYLGATKMYTRATISELKELAEEYL